MAARSLSLALAALAAVAAVPSLSVAATTSVLLGDPAVGSSVVASAPDGQPVTLDVDVRHPGLAESARGRVHRDTTVHEGVVRVRLVGCIRFRDGRCDSSNGPTLATVGSRQGLLLGRGDRAVSATYRFPLGPAASARVRAAGPAVRAEITALSRVVIDGRSRPLEVDATSVTRPVGVTEASLSDVAAPRCENVRSVASFGRTTRIAIRCTGGNPDLALTAAPARGSARLVARKGGRALVDYTPPRGFTGTTTVGVTAQNAGGTTVVSRSVTVRPFRLRALGDSVTGGFGYLGSGIAWDALDLVECIPPTPLNDRCTSNSPNGVGVDGPVGWLPDFGLANNVAWPAQFANRNNISGAAFANYGVSGSTPANWDVGGPLNGTLASIVSSQPDLTVMTLGANPLLDVFLAGRGIGCAATLSEAAFRRCIRSFIQQQMLVPRVRSVIAQLLVAPSNRVVVSQYHSAIPSATIFSVASLRIMFQELNLAVSNAATGAPGFGSRVFLMGPPLFPAGLPPGLVSCPDGGELVDGQSRQSRVTQDELTVVDPFSFCGSDTFWIISQDTGIHPSREGHAQFAGALQRVVDQNNLMPGGSPPPTVG